jgi:hypothetical protein
LCRYHVTNSCAKEDDTNTRVGTTNLERTLEDEDEEVLSGAGYGACGVVLTERGDGEDELEAKVGE